MIKKINCLILLSVVYLLFQVSVSQAESLKISKDGNVRSGPSTKHEIIGKVTAGTKVTQLEQSDSWYRVKLSDGEVGWVHRILVEPDKKTAIEEGNAQEAVVNRTPVELFKAGGTPIAIPPPTSDMTEVGYDNRELMEVFVIPNNRLIAAFVLTNDLLRLTKKADDLSISKYALVQVLRNGEYMDCTPNDFKEGISDVSEQFGDAINSSSMKEAEEEFNQRMKSLDLDVAVSLDKPLQLGCLFSKEDAWGFGMIAPVSVGGQNIKIASGIVLMRVKLRVLFVYLYAEYKNEDTIKWIRKTTENWADAILKANK